MANARQSERFSDREFSALLEDDSDGHRLAEFLLKRKGIDKRPKRVFAEYKPTRYSIEVRTEPIKTEKTIPVQLPDEVIDLISPVQEKADADVALETGSQIKDSTVVTAATAPSTAAPSLHNVPASPPAPVRLSPSQRLSLHRSGGMPNADRLRRFTLKRLSKLPSNNSSGGRRTLLQEFENTISNSNFSPPICSTPMSQLLTEEIPNVTPAPTTVPHEKDNTVVDNGHNTIVAETETTPMPSSSIHTETNNERLLSTLIKHNQELNDLLNKDGNISLVEKENLYRTLTTTPPPVNNLRSRPNTPSSQQRRRTYTIEKGSLPGQVVLTPAKKQPEQQQQQEQPSSTVDGCGGLERPTSPVEEAVYALHNVNKVSSSNMQTPKPIVASPKPIVASPKVMNALQRLIGKSPQPAMKVKSAKKSRIPLIRPTEKLQGLKPLDEVESTPEKVCNASVDETSSLEIPETQEQIQGHVEILETQYLDKGTQELLKNLQKAQSPASPMIVIPIQQTFNHTPISQEMIIAGKKLTSSKECADDSANDIQSSQPHIEADTTMQQLLTTQNKTKDKLRTSPRNNKSHSTLPPEPEKLPHEDELRLCDIITDDEDELPASSASRRGTNNDATAEVSKMENSNAPLNLAASHTSNEKRTRRLRKRSSNRRAQQMKRSPLLTTETECEMGPPRAHPPTTKRTNTLRDSRRKIPLNAEPNTPINGERFAVEMKTHLARLKNHEILDLRKRNSLGKVYPISGRRKSFLSNALEKKLQLENEIQMEILKRTLEGKLRADDPLLTNADQEELESCSDDQQQGDTMFGIPPAPEDFRDHTNEHLGLAKSVLQQLSNSRRESSLADDKSCDQVKFVREVPDVSTIKSKGSRRLRRCKKDMPEVMKKYLDVHQRWSQTPKLRNSSSKKRHLYSQENSDETAEQTSPETITPPTKQPAVTAKRVAEKTPSTSTYLSSIIIDNPLPPPDLFADDNTNLTANRSMAVSTVAGTSIANDTDDNNVFKKPQLPAPVAKSKKKNSAKTRAKESKKKNVVEVPKTPQPTTNNAEEDVTAEPHNATESLRRSKRGPKPLRNYWSFRSTDPTPLYDVAILEKRREEARQLREAKSSFKCSNVVDNTTIPSASSTLNKSVKKTAEKRGRPRKIVEETESDESSTSSIGLISKPTRKKRLATISETEDASTETEVAERPIAAELESEQEANMGDNMFARLDEVDISSARSHKISRTPQKTIKEKKSKAVNSKAKAVEKKETEKASKKATKKGTKYATEKALSKAREEASKRATDAASESAAKEAPKKTAENASKKAEKRVHQKNKKSDKLADVDHREASWETPSCSTSISIQSSTAAHINDIFEKLKNTTVDATPVRPIVAKPTMSTLPTALKKARVRLPRLKQIDSSCSASSSTANTNLSCDYNTNVPSWLRDISHVGSKILKDSDKEKGMFFQHMHGSNPGNLVLTDVDGVDYVYYENDKEVPFGYMRFKPKQFKRAKTAKLYHLVFFVLSGNFKVSSNKDEAVFGDGAVITIYKGSRYTIENMSNSLSILMVFKRN